MPDATVTAATIRPEEAAHFGKLAKDWWDPKGSSAMLHRLNPVRLAFLREAIDLHWGGDPEGVKPLTGRAALDVGCGAGLLTEPLARLGADVTGVDAAAENVTAAQMHAAGSGLAIDYRHGELARLGLGQRPQGAPDAARRPLFKQYLSRVLQHQHSCRALRQRLFRPRRRQCIGQALLVGDACGDHGARGT